MASSPLSEQILLDTSRKLQELDVRSAAHTGRVNLLERDLKQILEAHPDLKRRVYALEKQVEEHERAIDELARGQRVISKTHADLVKDLAAVATDTTEAIARAAEGIPSDLPRPRLLDWVFRHSKEIAWLAGLVTTGGLAWLAGWLSDFFAWVAMVLEK